MTKVKKKVSRLKALVISIQIKVFRIITVILSNKFKVTLVEVEFVLKLKEIKYYRTLKSKVMIARNGLVNSRFR